jgi:4'-phosphopantetheinyl transferase
MNARTYAYWLEQGETDVPQTNQWLSAGELSRFEGLRFEKRRTDWRLGRWTAKRALASCLNIPDDVLSLSEIEIRAAPSGAPEVFLSDQRARVNISLSHRAGEALCVVGLSGARLGCDLELIEPREKSFITDFFTADEQNRIAQAPADEQPAVATLLWSAKESALKALHVGLRVDTISLDVIPTYTSKYSADGSYLGASWSRLSVHLIDGRILSGWWRCANNMVRTVVFQPVEITVPACSQRNGE